MKKRIGIFIDSTKASGGAYHELRYFIQSIEKNNNNENFEFVIIRENKNINFEKRFTNFEIINFKMNALQRYLQFLFCYHHFFRRIKKFFKIKNSFDDFLYRNKISHVFFTGPSQYAIYINEVGFSILIPDVSHKENIEFSEFTEISELERKDEIFKKSLPRATFIITNSKIIKKRISFFYRILEQRIITISQQPTSLISNFNIEKNNTNLKDFKNKNHLPSNYIFYPAMYFPHKNHRLIIDAIKIMNHNEKINLSAIFCGKDKGLLLKLKNYAEKLNISDKITFLDFIKEKDLPFYYCNSQALVMPSLAGPTNIPPWEAFKLRTPVFYSQLEGVEDVLKDGAYYIDPLNPHKLVEGLKKLLNDGEFKKNLVKNGLKVLESNNNKMEFEKFFTKLNQVIDIEQRKKFD